jgi:hypothetical protein
MTEGTRVEPPISLIAGSHYNLPRASGSGGVAGQHTAIEVADNEPSTTPARDERRFARLSLSDCFTREAPA